MQPSYARSLGIEILEKPTLEQMISPVTRAVDPRASTWLISRAVALGAEIDSERYPAHDYVAGRLIAAIGFDSRACLEEWASWFMLSVLRHRRNASWQSPDDSGVPFEVIHALAGSLVQDAAALTKPQ